MDLPAVSRTPLVLRSSSSPSVSLIIQPVTSPLLRSLLFGESGKWGAQAKHLRSPRSHQGHENPRQLTVIARSADAWPGRLLCTHAPLILPGVSHGRPLPVPVYRRGHGITAGVAPARPSCTARTGQIWGFNSDCQHSVLLRLKTAAAMRSLLEMTGCGLRSSELGVRCADARGAGGSEALTPPPRGDDGGDGGGGRGHSEEAEPHMVSHVQGRRQTGREKFCVPTGRRSGRGGQAGPARGACGTRGAAGCARAGRRGHAPPRPWTALHFRVSFYPTAFLKVWPTDRAGTTFRSPRRLPGRHTERCVLAGAGDRARLSLRGPARQGSLGACSRGSFLAGCGARTPLCRERRWPEARARGLPASPSPQPAGHPGS